LKQLRAEEMVEKKPGAILCTAVEGMLPKNRLAKQQIKKLKAYSGTEHPHQAQNPEPLTAN
jgi:large subunit ribosomal protein L13